MSKISAYSDATTPTFNDKVIGTEIAATPANATKNFTLAQLVVLFNGGDAPPTTGTASIGKGEIKVSETHIYIYTGTVWKRAAISTF